MFVGTCDFAVPTYDCTVTPPALLVPARLRRARAASEWSHRREATAAYRRDPLDSRAAVDFTPAAWRMTNPRLPVSLGGFLVAEISARRRIHRMMSDQLLDIAKGNLTHHATDDIVGILIRPL